MDVATPLLLIGNLGTGEILVILLLLLLLFGAHKIPDLARALGKAQREFQRARDEIENEHRGAHGGEEERLRQAARNLGIAVQGKSAEELRAAIAAKVQPGTPGPPQA